jgi:hypothetical protein
MEIKQRRDLAEIMRDEMVMQDKIVACLHDEPKTIPEIAEALDCPGHVALQHRGRGREAANRGIFPLHVEPRRFMTMTTECGGDCSE